MSDCQLGTSVVDANDCEHPPKRYTHTCIYTCAHAHTHTHTHTHTTLRPDTEHVQQQQKNNQNYIKAETKTVQNNNRKMKGGRRIRREQQEAKILHVNLARLCPHKDTISASRYAHLIWIQLSKPPAHT